MGSTEREEDPRGWTRRGPGDVARGSTRKRDMEGPRVDLEDTQGESGQPRAVRGADVSTD